MVQWDILESCHFYDSTFWRNIFYGSEYKIQNLFYISNIGDVNGGMYDLNECEHLGHSNAGRLELKNFSEDNCVIGNSFVFCVRFVTHVSQVPLYESYC